MSIDKLCPKCKTEMKKYKLFFEYGECAKCGYHMQEAEKIVVKFEDIKINGK